MPTSVGPNTFGEENLVFGYDLGNFPYGWGVTQLLTDSEFTSQTSPLTFSNSFTNANYLGQYSNGLLTGTSLIFSGGDSANYSVSRPEIWGWDRGGIGSTGGNWVYANILPNVSQSAVDYVVECKWRFNYIALTGNGTTNPTFEIGRAYARFFQRSFSDTGNSYDWQYTKFGFNGAQTAYNTNTQFTIGLTSADSAVEVDYLRVYRIEKATGLKDLTGNSTIDITNVSFDSNAQMTFDGTDDQFVLSDPGVGTSFSIEVLIKVNDYSNGPRFISPSSVGIDHFLQVNTNGNIVAKFVEVPDSASDNYASTTVLSTGEYYHVIISKTPSNGTLHINGVAEDSHTPTLPAAAWSGDWRIGARWNSTFFLDGEIPMMKIYNRALTASEIKANYNAIKGRFNI